jgi:hypothetical protein
MRINLESTLGSFICAFVIMPLLIGSPFIILGLASSAMTYQPEPASCGSYSYHC